MIEPQKLAPNVCSRCKARKKKCDKALPRCGRCTRLGVTCLFGADPGALPSQIDLDDANNGMMSMNLGQTSHSLPEIITPFAFITPSFDLPLGNYLREGDDEILDLDEQLTRQAYDIMTRTGADITEIYSFFFRSIHQWFPVISETQIQELLANPQTTWRAESSCLLLNIYLLTQMGHQRATRDSMQRLYLTAKSFHSLVVSTGRSSLEIIQAGLLIALYEYCQALHESCYLSLGVCARMGYLLELQKTMTQATASNCAGQVLLETRRRVWWGIIIVERMAMLELMDKRLPFSIPTPAHMDILPVDDGILRPVCAGLEFSLSPSSFTTNMNMQPGVFLRTAQATYLLSRVIDHIYESYTIAPENSGACNAGKLDNALRNYSMSLLSLEGEPGYECWPNSICHSALLKLNTREVAVINRPELDEEHSQMFSIRASLAVKSVMKMVFEGLAQAGNARMDPNVVPVWVLESAYAAAMLFVNGENLADFNEEGIRAVQSVKMMFGMVEPKWRLAGTYLEAILSAERSKSERV